MKLSVISTTLPALTGAQSTAAIEAGRHDNEFEDNMHFLHFVHEHGLSFDTAVEFDFRKNLFLEKDSKIKAFMEEHPEATYQVGHNAFSILTDEEWAAKFTVNAAEIVQVRQDVCSVYLGSGDQSEPINRDPINWVSLGAVTPVMYEASCNSDWAIATIGAVEGAYFVFSGTEKDLKTLSP